jgi:hypothetical protein
MGSLQFWAPIGGVRPAPAGSSGLPGVPVALDGVVRLAEADRVNRWMGASSMPGGRERAGWFLGSWSWARMRSGRTGYPGALVPPGDWFPAAIRRRCKAQGGGAGWRKGSRRLRHRETDLARHGARGSGTAWQRGTGLAKPRSRAGAASAGPVFACRAAGRPAWPRGRGPAARWRAGRPVGWAGGRVRPLAWGWCLLAGVSLACGPAASGRVRWPHDPELLIIGATAGARRIA